MELNPNHPVTMEVHDHWHKIAALLMMKFGLVATKITTEEIARLGESGMNIAIKPNDQEGCIELWLVSDAEAVKLARKEGGLPV